VKALRFHGPGDLRLEDVPSPEPGPGDVLVQVEVALTDGTDLKTFRRGHPVLLRELPSPFGHEFCGIDVATGRRVVAANSAATDERGAPIELLNGAYAELLLVPAAIAAVNLLPVPPELAPEVAAMVEPLACCLRGVERAQIARSVEPQRPHAPGRLPLPPGGAGLRGRLTPLAALRPKARTSVLFHRPPHRERRPRSVRNFTA